MSHWYSLVLLVALMCMIVYDHFRSWGSVVVRLDDRGVLIQFLEGARVFSP